MKNVLIVDDEIAVLSLLKHSLIKYRSEFKVLTAKNGNEAKSILSKKPVSLLVTDIIMPDITGFELLEYVKKKYPATLCYVMTAYNTTEIKKKIPHHVIEFLKKPFSISKLGPKILKTLKQDTPTGFISGISAATLLLMLEKEKRTCLFEVTFPDNTKGIVYLINGVIQKAMYESLNGENAVRAIVAKGKARFWFKPLTERMIESLVTTYQS